MQVLSFSEKKDYSRCSILYNKRILIRERIEGDITWYETLENKKLSILNIDLNVAENSFNVALIEFKKQSLNSN